VVIIAPLVRVVPGTVISALMFMLAYCCKVKVGLMIIVVR